MRILTVILGLAVLLSFLAACESLPAAPDPAVDPVGYGQVMYERKCATCHELYNPREFSRRAWTRAIKRYGPRAGLKREDRPYVEQYLHENASDAP